MNTPTTSCSDSASSLAITTAGEPPPLTERLRVLRDSLLTGLVERDVAVRLALIASLAGEHLLLIGPPGTAKSLIARRLRLAFADSTYFERLLTRFTVPEELFGPLSILGLQEDRYERLVDAYLPTASIAFLDEIFKANSAILNALLTLLNEREFDNGTQRIDTPLVAVVGASNELPEAEELNALYDRFLLRLHLGPVTRAGFRDLLKLRGKAVPEVDAAVQITGEVLAEVQAAAEQVEVPGDVEALLCELRDWCAAEELPVSDRRWRKVVKLLQVAALTNGRQQVSIWDCWLLQHCLWDVPEDREKVYEWYASRVGTSQAWTPDRLTRIVVAWEAKLEVDRKSLSQARDEKGQLLFTSPGGGPTAESYGKTRAMRDTEPLFLAPTRCSTNRNYGYSQHRVQDRKGGGRGFTESELDELWIHSGHSGYADYQFCHWPGRETYLTDRSNWFYVAGDNRPLMEPTRQKTLYIDDCLRQIDALRSDVETYAAQLTQHIESMEALVRGHLWVTPDFVEPANTTLHETNREVQTLLSRVDSLRKGFELLPREEDTPPARPKSKAKRKSSAKRRRR